MTNLFEHTENIVCITIFTLIFLTIVSGAVCILNDKFYDKAHDTERKIANACAALNHTQYIHMYDTRLEVEVNKLRDDLIKHCDSLKHITTSYDIYHELHKQPVRVASNKPFIEQLRNLDNRVNRTSYAISNLTRTK